MKDDPTVTVALELTEAELRSVVWQSIASIPYSNVLTKLLGACRAVHFPKPQNPAKVALLEALDEWEGLWLSEIATTSCPAPPERIAELRALAERLPDEVAS